MKTRTIRLRTYNLLFAWVYNNGRLLYTSYNGRIGKYEDVYLVGRGTWRCTRDRRGYVESVAFNRNLVPDRPMYNMNRYNKPVLGGE